MARSSAETLDKLAKAPARTKILLLVLVLGVLGGLYWYLFYSEMSDEESQLRTTNARLTEDRRKLNDRLKQFQDLLRQKLELEDSLKRNAVKLPSSAELPAFFQHLQVQAGTANVQIDSFVRDKEVPIETYVKVPVKMAVSGDYYQLLHFFKLLNETPRIITIEALKIGTGKKQGVVDRRVLTAEFVASTFRQADRPPQPAPAPATPPAPKPGQSPAPAQPPKPGAPAAPTGPNAPKPAAPASPTGGGK